ncbi:MAG: DNA mismatch repair protein, partial [Euryarchaeota archaeon]|nr:DNA mismatch repair protein [Euryarchaeota archaeon]
GIEARGLDENLELIVDRTPIRNHLAQTTPELIVRRLAARAQGPSASIFSTLIKRFKD